MFENQKKPLLLQANFLGGYEIRINGCVINGLSSQKAKALFAYLILEHERTLSRSLLASLFWPDVAEETALHNLRQALSTIRKGLTDSNCFDELFIPAREHLCFAESVSFDVDVLNFENQSKTLLASNGGKPGRGFPIHLLIKLIQEYKGQLLPSVTLADSELFEEWLIVKRETINRLLIESTSLLLNYFEFRGEWSSARKYAELLVSLAPWDENAHYHLIQIFLQLSQVNLAANHYQSAVRYLQKELQVEPGQLLLSAHEEIETFFASSNPPQKIQSLQLKLPGYATPFIGREQEMNTLEYWISMPETSVITITGPGGSGKTRLAVELVNAQNSLFKDGVFFVSIAGCHRLDQLAANILGVVEIGNELSEDAVKDLMDWAHNRSSLLVLDNVDNIQECAVLATLLRENSSNLILVFTSYSPLNLVGEKIYCLNGLGLSEGLSSDAVKLFYSQLQLDSSPQINHPDFGNQVLQICELVEGLPLAIDLAASQSRWIPIAELLKELNEKMDVLNSEAVNLPERHRSIQASFENVWKHLDARQKQILPLLTIFQDPFSFEAAEYICGASAVELRALAARSLLIWDGQECYRFHRVVKLCASEKSELTEEENQNLFKRYADWFFHHLVDLYNDHKGERIFIFNQNVELILTDIKQTLDWFITTQNWKQVENMIAPLNLYFEGRSLFREGALLFESCVEKCSKFLNAVICLAKFTCRTTMFKIHLQQFNHSIENIQFGLDIAQKNNLLDEVAYCINLKATHAILRKNASTSLNYSLEALELARQIGNREEEAHSLYNLGYAQDNMGLITEAEKTLHESRFICEEQKNWRRLAKVLNILADIACFHGDYQLAIRYYENSLEIVWQLHNKYSESLVMNNLGTAYLELFQYDQAEKYFLKSLQICREINDREGEAIALSNLGEMAAYQKDFSNAATYNQQSLEISMEIESDWGVMSSRIVLAEAYREFGDQKAAQNELIHLLQMAIQTESMNFFHRAVVEAARLLQGRGFDEVLYSFLAKTINADGAEESTRKKAQQTLASLKEPPNSNEDLSTQQISEFLIEKLENI